MLRLLHTSDWHLGAAFHDQDRSDDEASALDQIVALARAELVDAVIIAGDVFDTASPSAAAQRRYFDCLRRLVIDGVGSTVVIAGNHDNGLRLDGPRELLDPLRLHIRGQLLRGASAEACLLPLRPRGGGEVAGWCEAVPYLRDADLDCIDLGVGAVETRERLARALKSRFSEIRAAAQQRASGKPVVVTAHSFVTGARRAGDERPVIGQLGNVAQLEGSAVGEGVAYVALGHLHQPQAIAGHEHWRYCGSLLPMGFDEVATPRQVVIADLPEDGAPARVREVPLVPFRRYARVRGKPSEIEAAIALLHEGQRGEPTPWLEAVAELDGPNPAIARDVQAWAQARGWAALAIRSSHADAATARQWEEKAALAELDPVEVFRRLWTTTYPEQEPQPELIAAYEGLLARVRAEG